MLTKRMVIEKDVWDLPCAIRENPDPIWEEEVKEDWMAIGIAQGIIAEGVSDQIAMSIMDLENPRTSKTLRDVRQALTVFAQK